MGGAPFIKSEEAPVSRSTEAVGATALVVVPSIEHEIRSLWDSGQKNKAERKLNKWMADDKKSPAPYVLAAEFSFDEIPKLR